MFNRLLVLMTFLSFSYVDASPLHDAVNKGDIEEVTILIENGADIEERLPTFLYVNEEFKEYRSGNTPLEEAIKTKNLEIVKLLLNKGANPYQMAKKEYGAHQSAIHAVIDGYIVASTATVIQSKIIPDYESQRFFIAVIRFMRKLGVDFNQVCFRHKLTDYSGVELIWRSRKLYDDPIWKNKNEILHFFDNALEIMQSTS